MDLDDMSDRARAAEALRRLVGGDAERFTDPKLPASLLLPAAQLIVAAGDTDHPLDPFDLKAIAVRAHKDVMAIWVDRMLAGHALLIDALLIEDGRAEQFCAYQLWMGRDDERVLVPQHGNGSCIGITAGGSRSIPTRPWRDQIERLTGITMGQAFLHRLVWTGTPYATPADGALER